MCFHLYRSFTLMRVLTSIMSKTYSIFLDNTVILGCWVGGGGIDVSKTQTNIGSNRECGCVHAGLIIKNNEM